MIYEQTRLLMLISSLIRWGETYPWMKPHIANALASYGITFDA